MSTRSNVSQASLEAALAELLKALDSGAEYPDAHSRVSSKHKVPAELLQVAYDEYCVGG